MLKHFPFTYTLQLACLLTALGGELYAVDPLAAKTMVVYVSNSPDSVAVKDHYIAARSITAVCAITLPDPTAIALNQTDYNTYVKAPIRNCLVTEGKTKILYIVLAYVRPFRYLTNTGFLALDSYVADVWDQYTTQNFFLVPSAPHRYFADNQNQGNVYLPFQTFEAYRASPRSTLIYSVWRLDGATPAIANGLVDGATTAMNNLTGAVCIDRNHGPITNLRDVSYDAGEFDLFKAATFMNQAGFTVTEDTNNEEFGTSPAPLTCPAPAGTPVAFYSGWYSFNHYNGAGVFNFAPGSIGVHLDSNSAADPRSGPNWVANALLNGITVTSGAVNEPYLDGLTRPGGLARNLLEGANVGDAFLRNTRWLKWVILNVGDPLYRPFPITGKAPFNPPAPTSSLFLANRQLVGGASTTGTVTLATIAPVGGTAVTLTSETPSIAAVPSGALIPAGARSVTFPITTTTVNSSFVPIITATSGSTTVTNTLAVDPLLSFIALSENATSSARPVTGTVYLNGNAPPGGVALSLGSSDTSAATVPPNAFIPAGLSRVNFPITPVSVTAPKTTNIFATYGVTTTQSQLTILPAIYSALFGVPTINTGQTTKFEVGLRFPAPPGGAVVTLTNSNPTAVPLSSSTIIIPAGVTYGIVTFTAGSGPATATVTATYSGDTKSDTITIN